MPQSHKNFSNDTRYRYRYRRGYRIDGNRKRRARDSRKKHSEYGREHHTRLAGDNHPRRRKLRRERKGEYNAHRRKRNFKGLPVGRCRFAGCQRSRTNHLRRKKLESVQHHRRQRRLFENRQLDCRRRRAHFAAPCYARFKSLPCGLYDSPRALRGRKSHRQGFANSECGV